jgi:hypothetical protein
MRKIHKIYTIIFCLVLSALCFIIMFYTRNSMQIEEMVSESSVYIEKIEDISDELSSPDAEVSESLTSSILPKEDNEVLPELYLPEGGLQTFVYFTNTEELDESGVIPLNINAIIVEETQRYLNGQGIEAGELRYRVDDTKITGKDVTFRCDMIGTELILKISYSAEFKELHFGIDKE